jgi:hypothetical protein
MWRCRTACPVRLGGVFSAGGVQRSPHKSGSSLALRAACAPWLRVLVPRRPPPQPSLRSPCATGHSPPPPLVLKAPRPGLQGEAPKAGVRRRGRTTSLYQGEATRPDQGWSWGKNTGSGRTFRGAHLLKAKSG